MCVLLWGVLCLCLSPTSTPPNRRILKAHTNHCPCSKPLSLPLPLLFNTTQGHSMILLLVSSLIKMTGFLPPYLCPPPSKVTSWPWSSSSVSESLGGHALTCMVRLSEKHQLNPPLVSDFKSESLLVALCRAYCKTLLSQGPLQVTEVAI